MNDLIQFTEEDEASSTALGPEYFASQRLAADIMQKFDAEHLKPLVEKVADEFREKLWDDVRDWLLCDAEINVHGAVRDMVEQTINALLTGKEWAMQRYPYANFSRGEEIRKAVAAHGSDKLLMARIADLEAELVKKTETIRHLRDAY